MKKSIQMAMLVIGLICPVASLADDVHTAKQEQQEQMASGTQIVAGRNPHIEAFEERMLGHDAHEKVEWVHTFVEENSGMVVVGFVMIVSLATLGGIRFAARKSRT